MEFGTNIAPMICVSKVYYLKMDVSRLEKIMEEFE